MVPTPKKKNMSEKQNHGRFFSEKKSKDSKGAEK